MEYGLMIFAPILMIGGFYCAKQSAELGSIIEMLIGFVPKKYRKKEKYIFLSWSVRTPREAAAMKGIIKALDYFGLGYFDYTKYQVDETKDSSDEIKNNILTAIRKSDCSIEIVSFNILYHRWIQFERQKLRNHPISSVVLCLDNEYIDFTGADNEQVFRINFSDGRSGRLKVDEFKQFEYEGTIDDYYHSYSYYKQCLDFARSLSNSLLQNNAKFMKIFIAKNNAQHIKRMRQRA